MTIKGTVVYQNLGPGFWGIVDQGGKQWRPVEMPKALQNEGKQVVAKVEKMPDGVSIFMWGTPVRIISFS